MSLYGGPVPYSTYDLAVAAATNLFIHADTDRRAELSNIQLLSRMTLHEWLLQRKVAPLIAKSFEDTLYKMYKA
jgi:hypothetical protein